MHFVAVPNMTTYNMIETCSGRYVDVANPDPNTISIDDIAWALSRQSRFAGHTLSEEIWSVGQHSLFVQSLLDLVLSENGIRLQKSLIQYLDSKEVLREYKGNNFSKKAVLMGGLIHDGTEAYLVDLPTPVKRYSGVVSGYRELESKMEKAIYASLSLPLLTEVEHQLVKWADVLALRIEAAHLLPSRGRGWGLEIPIMNHTDVYLFPQIKKWDIVAREFISCFNKLNAMV